MPHIPRPRGASRGHPSVHPLEPRQLFASVPASVVPASLPTLRINAGGPAFVDHLSRTSSADAGFSAGSSAVAPAVPYDVLNTDDDPLFLTYRAGADFTFSRPATNGHYSLWLEFAEPNPAAAAGSRLFNVSAEGSAFLTNFDVTQSAGAPRTAVARNTDLTISDGSLDLSFHATAGQAIVSAVVLIPLDVPQPAAPYSWLALSDSARDLKAAANLRRLGQDLLLYSSEHKNKFPASLAELTTSADEIPDTFASPRTNSALPRGELSQTEFAAWVASRTDFVYTGAGKRNDLPADDVLAYENPNRVAGDVFVLRGDGRVDRLTRPQAAALVGFPDAPPADPPAPRPTVPAPDPANQQNRINLLKIGNSINSFANQQRNFYPRFLGDLYPFHNVVPSDVIDPLAPDVSLPPPGLSPSETSDWINAHADYAYVPVNQARTKAGPNDLVAYQKDAGAAGGAFLLFADGRVEFRDSAWAAETVAAQLPVVRSIAFDPAAQALRLTLNKNASFGLTPDTLVLTDTATNQRIDPSLIDASFDPATLTATFSLTRLPGGSLPTGLYSATLASPRPTDAGGNPLNLSLSYTFLWVATGETFTLPPLATSGTTTASAVLLAPGARLDLGAGQLDLAANDHPTSAAAIPLVAAAYNHGRWDHPGITSLAAASDPARLTGVGHSDQGFNGFSRKYHLTLRPTSYGDANLNGSLSADDVATMLLAQSQNRTDWQAGNFNYDTRISPDDWALFAQAAAYAQPTGEPAPFAFTSDPENDAPPGITEALLSSGADEK